MVIEFQKAEDVKPADFKPHPLAELFPMMDDDAFLDFAQDIEKHGQREPIIIYENKILDGRNRYKACQMLGFSPRFKEYNGNDALGFVISLNLKRRHLTESQRAMVGAKLATATKGGMRDPERANLPVRNEPTNAEAGKLLNVSERSIKTAKQVQKTGVPELVKAVEDGAVSVSAAAVIAKETPEVQRYVVTPSQEKELSTALKRLQNAKAQDAEADKFVPPEPLSEDEKAERERIFGTREVRSFLSKVLTTSELVPTLPPPEELARSVPAAMENIITDNINAMREVSKWFDAFATAWQAKE